MTRQERPQFGYDYSQEIYRITNNLHSEHQVYKRDGGEFGATDALETIMKKRKLRFLFVYKDMTMGGIETLINRMTKWLLDNGHEVSLLLCDIGDSPDLIDDRINYFILKDQSWRKYMVRNWRKGIRGVIKESSDLIFCLGGSNAIWATRVHEAFVSMKKRAPHLLIGVYHPREINLSGRLTVMSYLLSLFFRHGVIPQSLLFMSEFVKNSFARDCACSFNNAHVLPLPIEAQRFERIKRIPQRFKIVSVGRLDSWKTYNWYMIDIIHLLRSEGYPVTYEIYGDGHQAEMISNLVSKNGLDGLVHLKGNISYNELHHAFTDAYAFVGMGTSLIEAGFAGVPCVPAIDNDISGSTYGFLYDLPLYSCGELLEKPPAITVISLLRRLFEMSEVEYQNESIKTKRYVQPYHIDNVMNGFLNIMENAPISLNRRNFARILAMVSATHAFLAPLRKPISKIVRPWIR